MKFYIFFPLVYIVMGSCIWAQQAPVTTRGDQEFLPVVRGLVLNAYTGAPVGDVRITIRELGIENYSNAEGQFTFKNIPVRPLTLFLEHGDYITGEETFDIPDGTLLLSIRPNSLDLDEVVVIGKKDLKTPSSATVINRKAIEHLQATNLREVLQLVPGNLIENPTFTNTNQANIRQYKADNLGSLGTSVIINGATISNNANLQAINTTRAGSGAAFSTSSGGGVDLRTISADNVERVEVIQGIPSVEYGDLNAGAILVQTKARKEPLTLKARFNPTLTQFWAGKGFNTDNDGSSLYVDLDYTKNNDSETNKYQNYTRVSGTAQYTRHFGKEKNWRTNTTLAYTYGKDSYDMDPDFVVDSVKTVSREHFIRFSSNGNITLDRKFSQQIKYTASLNYGDQKGYQQQYYTADITAESYALTNSTNEVPYLPSSYLSKMRVNGKPLSANFRISDHFNLYTGDYTHNILVGTAWKMDVNLGEGKTFNRPPRNTSAHAYRTRRYNDIPALHQFGLYVQDQFSGFIGKTAISIQAGLRYDLMQPFDKSYDLKALSPRLYASVKTPFNLTLRSGYGVTAKSPTLLYLYPENAYFDFYSLNHYAQRPEERMALITTRVFDSGNHDLKLSKTAKYEAGMDYNWGENGEKILSVTGYYEKTRNGYDMSTTLNSVKFAQHPVYAIESQPEGQQPVLSDEVSSMTRFVSYFAPSNNIRRVNKGVELNADFGKVDVINTSFNITGAYTSTKSVTNDYYMLQQNIAGRATTRVGVFAPGRGSVEERFVTTIRGIYHIPKLSFIVTLSAQTIWMDKNRYTGYQSLPVGYIPYNESGETPEIVFFSESERQGINKYDDPDIYLNINEATYITEKWQPLWLFNLKLTKEFRNGLNFSFFANNFINYRPLKSSTRYPTVYYKRNISFFFGSELSIRL